MRAKIVIGNWKMNKTYPDAVALMGQLKEQIEQQADKSVITAIAPPDIYLHEFADKLKDTAIGVGAQNCHAEVQGAFTGEVSAAMLAAIGVNYVLIGHSERRKYFHESNDFLAKKVNAALSAGMIPVFCMGETLEDRDASNHFTVVKTQLEESLFHLEPTKFEKVIVAYEPVWAIGTGKTATDEQAQEMHAFIRKTIAEKYQPEIAAKTALLYGGSCNPKTAPGLFACEDVDGGLIGGASLKADEFVQIINSF